jgi:hypothetical protein
MALRSRIVGKMEKVCNSSTSRIPSLAQRFSGVPPHPFLNVFPGWAISQKSLNLFIPDLDTAIAAVDGVSRRT